MRLRGSRAYYRPSPPKMPPGLVELMEGLTKEVLKSNPSEIYEFCANHMEQLLEKRDGPCKIVYDVTAPKKSLSLQEKIARAQHKIRQRADKRSQEFDKKFLQHQSGNSTNTETVDDLKLLASSAASVSDNITLDSNKDDLNELPEQQIKEIIKGHHKLDLKENIQLEIAEHPSPDSYARKESNLKVIETSSEELMENCDSIKENRIEQDALSLDLKRVIESTDIDVKRVNSDELINNEALSSISTLLVPVEHNIEHIAVDKLANRESLLDQEQAITSMEPNQILMPDTDRSVENDKEELNEFTIVNDVSNAHLVPDTDRSDENNKEELNEFSIVSDVSNAKLVPATDSSNEDDKEKGHGSAIVKEAKVLEQTLTDADRNYENDKEHNVSPIINEVNATGEIIGEQNDLNMFHVEGVDTSKYNSNTPDISTKNIQMEYKEPEIALASDKFEPVYIEQLDDVNSKESQVSPLTEKLNAENFHNLHTDNIQVSENSAIVMPTNDANDIQQLEDILAIESNCDILQKNIESIFLINNTPIDISNTDIEHSKEQNTIGNLCLNHNVTTLNTPVNGVDTDIKSYFNVNTTCGGSNLTTPRLEDSMNDEQQITIFLPSEIKYEIPFEDGGKVDTQDFNEIISDIIKPCHSQQNTDDNSTGLGITSSSITTQDSMTSNDCNSNAGRMSHINEHTQNDNLNTTNMDLETAAITIQKVFRNFLFKSRGGTFDDTANDDGANFLDDDVKNKAECAFAIESALNKDRRAHGMTRTDTILQTVNEEKSLSLSTDDSSTLSSAATTIQAHVRGFLVRNRLSSNKTVSTNSLPACNSNEPSLASLETDNEQNKSKTVLNIHIVPEGGDYLSRDESLINSMDFSLDSPTSSINLHPLSDDKSERRRRLKREDAIQSISPPSNNSGKLSDDFDSVKEIPFIEHAVGVNELITDNHIKDNLDINEIKPENGLILSGNKVNTEVVDNKENNTKDPDTRLENKIKYLTKMNSDERDVVTPFPSEDDNRLMHSGEFHDVVLPTKVSRCDTSVVRGE